MVKISDDVCGTLPDLTFFVVKGQWNNKFKPYANTIVIRRIFCTLEKSLSMRVVEPFLCKDNKDALFSIGFWNREINNRIEWEMNEVGICFAETGKIYKKDDFEELKKDYYIAKLSGLKQ